jgi:hypothetical protein
MSAKHVYSVYKDGRNQWLVRKLDRVFFFDEGHYTVTRNKVAWYCDCPADNRFTCRHIELVHIFTAAHKIGTDALYDFDRKRWVAEAKDAV